MAKICNQPKCTSTGIKNLHLYVDHAIHNSKYMESTCVHKQDKSIKKMRCICTMVYYSVIRKNEIFFCSNLDAYSEEEGGEGVKD